MPNYSYIALDARGHETRGALVVSDQTEALRRLKEMGFFPTKVFPDAGGRRLSRGRVTGPVPSRTGVLNIALELPGLRPRVKPRALVVFTRQVATLLEAGMPLLRGLRLMREQENSPALRRVLDEVSSAIEGGASFSEALALHPRAFNRLYVQMVKAGEISGALDVVLARLATFLEKAQRLKNKIVAAMFYPAAVITVAMAVLTVLVVFVIPRFEDVFQGLLNGRPMPAFTRFVFDLSMAAKQHALWLAGFAAGAVLGCRFATGTRPGRYVFDRLKLKFPVVGQVFRKAVIARLARTLGTLMANGVPILQALHIARETAGNVVVGRALAEVQAGVEEGEPVAVPLRQCGVFPAIVVGMVDIGEQTGALPEMLLKIADNYDDEVDNAVAAMTSLLEPAMIIFLAVIVGAIVIALFLPLVDCGLHIDGPGPNGTDA